jgi:hypothetical protein
MGKRERVILSFWRIFQFKKRKNWKKNTGIQKETRTSSHIKRRINETLDRVRPRVLVPDLGFHVLLRIVLLLLQSVQEKVEEETVVAKLKFFLNHIVVLRYIKKRLHGGVGTALLFGC